MSRRADAKALSDLGNVVARSRVHIVGNGVADQRVRVLAVGGEERVVRLVLPGEPPVVVGVAAVVDTAVVVLALPGTRADMLLPEQEGVAGAVRNRRQSRLAPEAGDAGVQAAVVE